jgi:hypothetical protein
LPNCFDGSHPQAALIADANGNLFGTTFAGGAGAYGGVYAGGGTVFEIVKTAGGYASTPTTLVSFCSLGMLPNCADGSHPQAGLIADANGNLFGTTFAGGASGGGTVFEIVKTASGYASTPTTLVSFCSLPNCADGGGPVAGLIADANGNLFGTTEGGGAYGLNGVGTVFEVVKTASGYASTPTILVSFCFGCPDGASPFAGLIADANGNLFGTTQYGGAGAYGGYGGRGTVFEIVKTASGYASTPTTLVSFCSLPNCADGSFPSAGLIADANGNLFGATYQGGASAGGGAAGRGTVFEIVKTASGYASTPTTLVSFCSLPNCADGANPVAGLIADANGNLFGTTEEGGASGGGTVFEITGSGFVPPPPFAGTAGEVGCIIKSNATLRGDYHGLNNAAADLGYPSVRALEMAILSYCWGI